MKAVRTRFAPSPTGFLHIGGIRTAIFSYLVAKHFNGQFILRIEDTDQERKVAGAIKGIIGDLAWLGVDIDEGPSVEDLTAVKEDTEGLVEIGGPKGPYIQSLRLSRYQEVAEMLVQSGAAYRCDCTPEMLQKERDEQMARKEQPGYSGYCRDRNVSKDTKHVVRLKIPARYQTGFNDLVKGPISWESVSLRDTVLLKSDGFPTYHLAVVVDDHDMEISHAFRGDEWIATTPIHLLVFESLGWEPPQIGHLPPVLGEDGKKLSKRHGATFLSNFRDAGFLPEALFNFVTLIGWSPGEGENQEIFSKQELIKRFSIDHINKAGGVFHNTKLSWMNGVYIRNLSKEDFATRVKPYFDEKGFDVEHKGFQFLIPHVQERIKLIPEALEMVSFLYEDSISRDLKSAIKKDIDAAKAVEILSAAKESLEGLANFSVEEIEKAFRGIAERLSLKAGPAFGVIRIALTGKMVTPPLFESCFALGKDISLKRLSEGVSEFNNFKA